LSCPEIRLHKKGRLDNIMKRFIRMFPFLVTILLLFLSIIYYSLVIIIATYSNLIIYPSRFIIVVLLAIIIIAVMYISMFTSLPHITREKALRAHEYYIAERITLASAFIIGIVSVLLISITIYLMAIITTLIAQYLIRSQYEFKMKP